MSDAARPEEGALLMTLRAHRHHLERIAARHGLSNLRVAPTGRALADVEPGRNYDDLAAFDAEVERDLGVRLDVHPAEVLGQPGHGRDLDRAVAL